VTAEWTLPEDLTAARVAREHVTAFLAERRVPEGTADDLVLIASELAANAIRHGAPPASLRLDDDHGRIRVTVSNHGDAPDPRVLTADLSSGHGRGLAMVETMADEVGWSREGDRLDVWAEVSLEQSP
jgi:anti-sigma regulatory factor (Ser/Thr protein kinase)